MSTRSLISYYDTKKKVYHTVFCHWDGYLSHNGRILLTAFDTLPKVKQLISFGNIDCLGEILHPTNPSKHKVGGDREENVCSFYHRDGKNQELEIEESKTQPKLNTWIEFVYIFKQGKWFYNSGNGLCVLTPDEIYPEEDDDGDPISPEDKKLKKKLIEFLDERKEAKKKLKYLDKLK